MDFYLINSNDKSVSMQKIDNIVTKRFLPRKNLWEIITIDILSSNQ